MLNQAPAMEPAAPAPEPPEIARLRAISKNPNLAADMDEMDLARIGDLVVREYQIDLDSMKTWKSRMERGIKLAALEKEERDYPWPKAANVKYPLVTTAVLMFNAKAYPAVVNGDRIVRVAVHGADPDGAKAAKAQRVGAHMSWQLTSKIVEWEEETDKLLTLLPLVGTMFRKTWYDPAWQRVRCRNILPGKLVINDRVTSLQDAPRCTEEITKYPAEIQEKRRSGEWLDVDYVESIGDDSSPPQDFLEQHRRMDLDGDGYDEPCIVTVHAVTKKVARIVADFTASDVTLDAKGKVASIRRGDYFTAFHFMPSLDGGFHSTGFGLLLGDISDTINTIINLMVDAGHMASLGGGFIGSDFRLKGGSQRHRPGEWKLASSSGAAIKDSIVPLTFPGPDATLFELLGLLIEAGKEVASVKDVLQGETGGKQMTATATIALIEQGMSQFTAAYKRVFRSLRQELALIARINRETVSPEEYNRFHDEVEPAPQMGHNGGPPMGDPMAPPAGPAMPSPEMMPPPPPQPRIYDPREEYDLDGMDITPVADPQSVTRMQEAAKAQVLMEMAEKGMVDQGEASKRMLEAVSVADINKLAPKPDPAAQAMMEAELAEKQAHAALMGAQAQAEGMEGSQGEAKMQELMLKARIAEATLGIKQAELQMRQMEMAQAQQEMGMAQPERAAKVDLTRAQTAKTMSDIQIDHAKLGLEAERQQQEAERGSAELGLKASAQATDAHYREREMEAARPEREAKVGLTQAQAKAAGKPKLAAKK